MSQHIFNLPDLGEGLTEADITHWLVAVGDEVALDQPIVEVETAKAAVEVPSPVAGTVAVLHGAEGETMEVGKPLITFGAAPAEGSAASREAPAAQPASDAAEEPAPSEDNGGSGAVLIGYGTSGEGAGVRRRRRKPAAVSPAEAGSARADHGGVAREEKHDWAANPPQEPSERQAPRVFNPLVRKLAREHGVRLESLQGTGPEGLIMRADVEAAIEAGSASPTQASAALAAVDSASAEGAGTSTSATSDPSAGAAGEVDKRTGLGVVGRTEIKGVRKVVAQTMTVSRTTIPEATVWVDVDATALVKLRAKIKEAEGRAPSFLAFISRFALAGLKRYPEMAMRIDGEAGAQQIVAFDGVNLGFAASTERGLVVPSIEHAEHLSIAEIDAALAQMTARAREGKCSPAELTRGTFTINNYGVFGVDGSAAIINTPEVAILGLGRILERPWVLSKDGRSKIRPRSVMELTLAFDHRVCDGATAGGFLRFVADCIENPQKAFLEF